MDNKSLYYDYSRIDSYNGFWNFILTNRGLGKTYGALKKCIKNFKKDGSQFMYVRRYKTELKNKDKFFDAVQKEFPKDDFKVFGNNGYCNGKPMVHFVALSTSQDLKSVPFPFVTTIIYDEFLTNSKFKKYIPDEVEVMADLVETVNRFREVEGSKPVRIYFLANNISLVNPYFRFFNCIPKNEKRFNTYKNGLIVIERFANEEFREKKHETVMGKLFEGTNYASYMIDNTSLKDDDTFIQKKKPKNAEFLFSIMYKGKETGIWISYSEGIWHCNSTIVTTSKNRFTITKEDHDLNYIMYNSLSQFTIFKDFVRYYKNGDARFEDNDIKEHIFEIMQYMNIR